MKSDDGSNWVPNQFVGSTNVGKANFPSPPPQVYSLLIFHPQSHSPFLLTPEPSRDLQVPGVLWCSLGCCFPGCLSGEPGNNRARGRCSWCSSCVCQKTKQQSSIQSKDLGPALQTWGRERRVLGIFPLYSSRFILSLSLPFVSENYTT